jgi:heptosyltransferase-2
VKVLIINTAFLGDVIFTAPLVDAVRAAGHAVHLLTRPRYGRLLARPGVTCIEYDKRGTQRSFQAFRTLCRALRELGFDAVLGAHPSIRSGLLARATRAPIRWGWGPVGYTRRVLRGPRFVDDALKLAAAIDAPIVTRQPRIFAARTQSDRVALIPGSRWGTKRWPHWAELAERLSAQGIPTVWIGAPDERHLAVGPGARCFEPGLEAATQTLAQCGVAVGGDSGLLHLARAVDTPTVMLFGPTDAGRLPPDPGRLDLSLPDLACRPCSPHGPKVCPLGHHRCMQELDVMRVHRAIDALIRRRE